MKTSKGSKPTNSGYFDMDQQLIDEVIARIKKDIEDGDTTALEEMLQGVLTRKTKRYMVAYLSEERALELGYDLNTQDDE